VILQEMAAMEPLLSAGEGDARGEGEVADHRGRQRRYFMRLAAAGLLVGAVAMNAVSFWKLNAGPEGDQERLAKLVDSGADGQIIGRNSRTVDPWQPLRASKAVARALENTAAAQYTDYRVRTDGWFASASRASLTIPIDLAVQANASGTVYVSVIGYSPDGESGDSVRLSTSSETDYITRVALEDADLSFAAKHIGADFEPVLRARFEVRPEHACFPPEYRIANRLSVGAYAGTFDGKPEYFVDSGALWRHEGSTVHFFLFVRSAERMRSMSFARAGTSWTVAPK